MAKSKFRVSDEELEALIGQYCNDFTAIERERPRDPITGRDAEINLAVLILLQRGRKNVVLQAPAGVGKTALVVGLAQHIVTDKVPELLKDARILEVDLASMSAGTSSMSEFHDRFIPLVRGIAERYHDKSAPRFILFIDEMHTIMPACEGSAYRGLSEVMKPYLTAGDLYVIGATTVEEFRTYVAIDPAMDRRFQKVHLKVPTDPETINILHAIKAGYEGHHNVKIPDEICNEIVELTSKYLRSRNQPDKSITTMDAACAKYVMDHGTGGTLDSQAVHYIVGSEANIDPRALGDK